ncbi:KTSC domain-containing protein [Rhizobium johnstonii]|uniref:KTSC domain-containing protein n=1 Tax=Rhizobium johnstonii TaxID=3019933 RepID=UPI003F97EDAC
MAGAEQLCPKYGRCIPADSFRCQIVSRSSLVTRVCYDEAKHYMIVRLKQADYHYCEVGPEIVQQFLAADSMGSFYNQNIKSGPTDGPFDCRTHSVPSY